MKKIVFLFAIIILLAGCSSEDNNQSDGLYIDRDAVHDLTIMVQSHNVAFLRHMANRFAEESGLNINFDFQTYDFITSISDRQALVTRLIGSDIDIFINGFGGFPTAGFASSTIFTNLNDFIDAEYGLDRENYFDHILRASEQNGNLYFMPIYIRPTGLISMNTYYANQINFSLDGITSLTMDERLNLWQEVANLNPDRRILLSNFFNFTNVIAPLGSVDIDNVYVNINNPEAIRRVEIAMQIPTRWVFAPEGIFITGGGVPGDILGEVGNLAPSAFFSPFQPKLDTLFHAVVEPLIFPWFSLVDGYESHKILPIDREGEGFFFPVLSFGILNDSSNQNLSLEFMRFLLDAHAYEATAEEWDFHYFRAGLWEGEQTPAFVDVAPYSSWGIGRALDNNPIASVMLSNFHINREVFSQFSQNLLRASYLQLLIDGTIEFDSIEAMNSAIDSAFQNYKNIIYLLNRNFNIPPTQNILHPQNFLLYSGNQSIEETLMNIQTILEIFVAEQGGF